VRPDGSACAPGELGNVIVTSLHGRAMPVIRLEPGDVARIFDDPCACGRKSRRIEHHGRIHSLLESAEGRWITERDVLDRVLACDGVSLFQLDQESPRDYRLAIVPDGPIDRAALHDVLLDLLGRGARIAIEEVDTLRTRASGKLQPVRSSTYERFRIASIRDRRVPVN